ncbi:MAG: SRPBCC domain-containing protein [Ectothiorhodospiraceae bacterium]|nr:SRPBCC domain-containing protein [Ectothiorhodospiraceae bacterium]
MKHLETEILIKGRPEQVWAVLTDFPRYPEWNPFIRQAEGDLRTGGRLRVRIHPPGGRPMTFRPLVRAARPGTELRWQGRVLLPGLFDGEHVFRMEPTGDGQVRFTQSERFRGLLVPLFPGSLYANTLRGFEAMNLALKDRVEGNR